MANRKEFRNTCSGFWPIGHEFNKPHLMRSVRQMAHKKRFFQSNKIAFLALGSEQTMEKKMYSTSLIVE
jgi:hypothetical protein